MRKYINAKNLLIAITIAAFLLWFANYVISSITLNSGGHSSFSSISYPRNSDTAFGGLLSTPSINDSLPYYKYKAIEDRFKNISNEREIENKSESISGTFNSHFGIGSIEKRSSREEERLAWKKMMDSLNIIENLISNLTNKDSIKVLEKKKAEIQNSLNNQNAIANDSVKAANQLYYFVLNNYSIDDDSKFYMHNNTYNLLYPIWGKYVKNDNGDSSRNGTYASKSLKIRYNTEDKRVLIPLTYGQHIFAAVLFYLYTFIGLVLYLYVFLNIPIQILYNISKGRAFTESNIIMWRQMAFAILFFVLWDFILPYLLRFLFSNWLTEDFELPSLLSRVTSMFFFSLLSIPFFIISIAFERGYKLQQEQDLTI